MITVKQNFDLRLIPNYFKLLCQNSLFLSDELFNVTFKTIMLPGEEYRTDVMVMDMQFMQAYWFYIMLMPINFADVSFPGLYKPGKASKYPFYNLKTFLDKNFDRSELLYLFLAIITYNTILIAIFKLARLVTFNTAVYNIHRRIVQC